MAGYLEQYGAGEERREKRSKLILTLGIVALVVLFLWFFFFVWDKTEIVRAQPIARLAQILRNHREEARVRTFLDLLRQGNYQAAYALWGCTADKPCRDYSFSEFEKDWGPNSSRNLKAYTIPKSRSCGSGVIVTVDYDHGQEDALWVQRGDMTMGFSPFPVCAPGS
jgi:hypothetical protein